MPSSPQSRAPTSLIRVQLHHEPVSLDPALAEDGVSLLILNNLFEGLMGYDGSGKLVNRMAESYSISADRKRYEFSLRKNAKWSDGEPVRVQDFITGLRRALGPKTTAKLATLLFPIRGAQAFHDGKLTQNELGIKEENGKLVIELDHPAPYLIEALTLPSTFPQRQDILDANEGKWPERGPVNGPYQILSHALDQKISLKENPSYSRSPYENHPKGQAPSSSESQPQNKVSQIDFYIVQEESTALNLFLKDRLDLLTRISAFDLPRLKKMGLLHTDPFLATYYLAFNCRKPPFQDSKLRRAIASVIKRDEITALLGSGETPAWGWIPPGLEGNILYQNPAQYYGISGANAKKENPFPETLEAVFDSGERNSRIMEKIQQDVSQSLGIRLSLNHMDWRTYVKTVQTNTPPIYRLGWLSPFMDPLPHLRIFKTNDVNNQAGFSNAHYDSLVEQIESLPPGRVRENLIQQAQNILIEEAPIVPIYHYVQNSAVARRVKGFRINPFGIIQFQEISMEK